MPREPSSNGANGRDPRGRFQRGNPGGPGNPYARAVAAFRRALYAALTPEDVTRLVQALRDRALDGDAACARLLLRYLVGEPDFSFRPREIDEEEKLADEWSADADARARERARIREMVAALSDML